MSEQLRVNENSDAAKWQALEGAGMGEDSVYPGQASDYDPYADVSGGEEGGHLSVVGSEGDPGGVSYFKIPGLTAVDGEDPYGVTPEHDDVTGTPKEPPVVTERMTAGERTPAPEVDSLEVKAFDDALERVRQVNKVDYTDSERQIRLAQAWDHYEREITRIRGAK